MIYWADRGAGPASSAEHDQRNGDSNVGDQWYDAFANAGAERRGSFPRQSLRGGHGSAQEGPLDQSGNQVIERMHDRSIGDHDLPTAVLKSRSSALEQLSDSNRRLMDRIDILLRIQEREQVLRQQLQNQVDRLSDRIPERALALPETPQVASDSVVNELKPVLTAMLDLLERCLPRAQASAESKTPAVQDRVEVPAPEVYPTLPEILRRPLEELTSGSGEEKPRKRTDGANIGGANTKETLPRPPVQTRAVMPG